MKLQNLILNLSKDDILKLISLQDKTIVKSLELGDQIKISGIYKARFLLDFCQFSCSNYTTDWLLWIEI